MNVWERLKRMQENIKKIDDALVGKEGESHGSAIIREDHFQMDDDVDRKREPVKGNPEDFKSLYHRGTV